MEWPWTQVDPSNCWCWWFLRQVKPWRALKSGSWVVTTCIPFFMCWWLRLDLGGLRPRTCQIGWLGYVDGVHWFQDGATSRIFEAVPNWNANLLIPDTGITQFPEQLDTSVFPTCLIFQLCFNRLIGIEGWPWRPWTTYWTSPYM